MTGVYRGTRGDLNFHHRPLNSRIILMNDTEVIALQAPIEYTMNDNAEIQNGRWAMLGIVAALGAYATTGQIIPGIFSVSYTHLRAHET